MVKLWIAVAVIIILIAAGIFIVTSPTGNIVKVGPIKIGFIGPLTGDAAFYGESEKNAITLAVEEINGQGGINGRLLEVVYEDGKGLGKEAVTAAEKLVSVDGVKIILGGAFSSETLAVAPVTERNHAILFTSFSSNPRISDAGDFVFRNGPRDDDAGRFLAQLAFEKGYRRVGILTENSDASIGLRDAFKERFEESEGKIVSSELFALGEKDYRTQLIKITAGNPDLIFLNPMSGITGGTGVKQIREMGILVPIFSTWVFSGKDALEVAGSAAEGIIFEDVPVLDLENPKAAAFLDKYKERFGDPASDWDAGATYDRTYIIRDALEECGEYTECIRDYLYSLEYDGVIGRYGFDSNGDVVGIGFAIKKIVNGEPELI